MIIIRLFHWAFRIKTLPVIENGEYIKNKERPPTFYEAITGISGT